MKHSSIALLTALILVTPPAAGFGYVEGRTTATATPGDSITFTAYLFGEAGTILLDGIDAPEGWTVSVSPEAVALPVTEPDRVLQTDTGYRSLRAIRTTVAIPPDAAEGVHTVTATFAQRAGGGGDLPVRQERRFRFTVTVEGGDRAATPGVSGEEAANETDAGSGPATAGTPDRSTAGTDDATAQTDRIPRPLIAGFLVFELLWVLAMWRILR